MTNKIRVKNITFRNRRDALYSLKNIKKAYPNLWCQVFKELFVGLVVIELLGDLTEEESLDESTANTVEDSLD